jgi:hypothetical protein
VTHAQTTPPNPLYATSRFRLAAIPDSWPSAFVIITAYASTGQRWSDAENVAADQKLSAEIAALGAWRLRITGYSPDTGHAEPGWAVELPIEHGRGIGRQFKQDAIFVIRADALGYVSCSGDGKVIWFGAFRERVDVASQ